MPTNQPSDAARAATLRPSLIATAAALAVLAALSFLLLHPAAGHAARANGPAVSTATTSLGRILVDPRGRTLYLFAKDKNDQSACNGQCATFWPPVLTTGKPQAGPGVDASLLGTTTRTDGKVEVTYAGHPLYYFQKDKAPGDTTGQGVNGFGDLWWVLKPSGAAITTK